MQLANALASLGWYLERREDEVKSLTEGERNAIESRIGHPLKDRVIRLKEATQAYVATFLRQPELAKKNPKRIFLGAFDGGSFERIFNSELSAEKFLQAQQLAWGVEALVKQFMTRKRRKERVESWRKDYEDVLGKALVEKHPEVLDQVIPQSAVFLSGLAYEEWVRLRGHDLRDLLSSIEKGDSEFFRRQILLIIEYAKSNKLMQSWPTLLKSQSFFENFASYLQGMIEADSKRK